MYLLLFSMVRDTMGYNLEFVIHSNCQIMLLKVKNKGKHNHYVGTNMDQSYCHTSNIGREEAKLLYPLSFIVIPKIMHSNLLGIIE